jgi:hypothetical protein
MNYGQIRTHFKALLNRSDITDSLADTFIDQGISRIQRSLRIPSMEKQHKYTFSAQTSKVILPADFLEAIDIYFANVALTRLPMREMQAFLDSGETGSPVYFLREGGELLLHPQPSSGTLSLNYYSVLPELSVDADSNILTEVAPDLIMYSALTYASDYFLDDRADIWAAKYFSFLDEIQTQANEQEMSGTLQQMRPAYQTY